MKYMIIYSLTDEEYQSFLNGIPFDNSKFMMSNYLQKKQESIKDFQNPNILLIV